MRLDDGGLLAALHRGVFEQPLWTEFLSKLMHITGSPYVSLTLKPSDEGRFVELHAGRWVSLNLDQRLADNNIVDRPMQRMRDSRVYTLEELLDPINRNHERLIRQLKADLGITAMRSVRETEPGGTSAWLSCAGGREIGSAVGSILTALAPHLAIALHCFVALERERFRSAAASAGNRRLNSGWLALDARCRIVEMTPDLEQLFQRSPVLNRSRYGRLTPSSAVADRELAELVKSFAENGVGPPKSINLSRDPLVDILVRPVHQQAGAVSQSAVAIVHVNGDQWSEADRCGQLVELFGLLPSEARLAWAIAQGMTIAEAADHLLLRPETARSYSKQIYAKMGVRGQAELVRQIFLSTSV
jgi:DNA-binding CsgD family transcriptional regulator